MSKQTAVEWLVEQFKKKGYIGRQDELQAKAMEREHMIEFTDNYVDNCVFPNENNAIPTTMDVPHYYDVTYGKEAGHE